MRLPNIECILFPGVLGVILKIVSPRETENVYMTLSSGLGYSSVVKHPTTINRWLQ